MTTSLRMLVVDDDPGVGDLLNRYFTRQGFDVSRAADGPALHAALARGRIDVILMDLGLPGKDGLDLTRELRADWNGALIIVTGRGESVDRVMGLELGADDYVTKPFDLRELLARVRSVLRRRNAEATPAPAAGYRFAGFTLEPRTRTLSVDGGGAIELTSGEYKLLLALVEQPHQVLSRDDLLDRTSGRAAAPFDRAIDVQIGRLRRKIEPDPARPTLIKSVRGVGYLFAAEVSRETTS